MIYSGKRVRSINSWWNTSCVCFIPYWNSKDSIHNYLCFVLYHHFMCMYDFAYKYDPQGSCLCCIRNLLLQLRLLCSLMNLWISCVQAYKSYRDQLNLPYWSFKRIKGSSCISGILYGSLYLFIIYFKFNLLEDKSFG